MARAQTDNENRVPLGVEALEDRAVPAGLAAAADPGGAWDTSAADARIDPAEAPNARFVKNLYRDLLGREADAGGLDGYVAALDRGEPRREIAEELLGSDERRVRNLAAAYRQLLGRAPDAAGIGGYLYETKKGDLQEKQRATTPPDPLNRSSDDPLLFSLLYTLAQSAAEPRVPTNQTLNDIAAEIVASPEFAARIPSNPSSPANAANARIAAAYQYYLFRPAGEDEVGAFRSRYPDRDEPAILEIGRSAEAHRRFAENAYRQLLGRDASDGELSSYDGALPDAVLASIAGSEEYLLRHGVRVFRPPELE